MEKIAIVGMACLFPGAESPEAYWQVLTEGRRTISAPTAEQLGVDPAAFYDPTRQRADTSYDLHGGYVRDFQFDPDGYQLPADQLASMDRLYQWSLHVARAALNDSGHQNRHDLLARCGVILGNLSFPTVQSQRLFEPLYDSAIDQAVNDLLESDSFALPRLPGAAHPLDGMSPGYPAAVIASALGLGGTHFAIDAACASSVYAVGLACDMLRSRRTELMLAGAVSAADQLFVNLGFAYLGGKPAGDGSNPLDADSGGLVPAEGAAMFVLKRHSDARRDGDRIYALVSGVGLSNDGQGKHILTPNSKGQVLALSRAYDAAGVDPEQIAYVECHASGTTVGDRTEMNSLETFFTGGNLPRIGSVKANLGHLLTTAGMASMMKVVLSLQHGQIPPTPGIRNPLTSQGGRFGAEQVVTQAMPWPQGNGPRRAGVNAFGFGGVSAHLILEANEQQPQPQESGPARPPLRMAITGMDAHFGPLENLNAFARALYDGASAFIDLPEQRWKGLELTGAAQGEPPRGAYIDGVELDFMRYRIPPNSADEPTPQQLLLLKVADNALRDAGIQPGANVAVLVALGTELELHRYRSRGDLNWQVEAALRDAGAELSPTQTAALERITKDALVAPAEVNHYTGTISNITASRVASVWDFTGPAFTVSAEENSAFKALELAELLLAASDVDAVLVGAVDLAGSPEAVLMRSGAASLHHGTPAVGFDAASNGWIVGEGAGAMVVTRAEQTDPERAYATIEAVSVISEPPTGTLPGAPSAQTVTQAAQNALRAARITPEQIGYLEMHGSGIPDEDTAEIAGLAAVYRADNPDLTCAIGSVKANVGHTFAASGMAALIKATLSAAHRFLPSVPHWSGPESPELWQGTPFWVATRSRTWFDPCRVAAVSGLSADGSAAHVILSAEGTSARGNGYLRGGAPHLLPVAGENIEVVRATLDDLRAALEAESPAVVAARAYALFAARTDAVYAAALVGNTADELRQEIDRAQAGIAAAAENGQTWSTPAGSFFTPNPVGSDGKVAFVYPGAFNPYPRMGYDLLHLFPQEYDALGAVKSDIGAAVGERVLYPRSLEKPGPRLTKAMKDALMDDPVGLVVTGSAFALLYTRAMRDVFDLQPDAAFGYSLGESSMLWGLGVWQNGDEASEAFGASDLFKTRLVGPMDVVREVWGIPADVPVEQFWAAYFIAAPAEAVEAACRQESRVYLTHINTPHEVMIAGDPTGCQRVLDSLGAESMRAPFSAALHSEVMMSAYNEYARLHHHPVYPPTGEVSFYSAADYGPVTLDSGVIANSIARMVCKPVDFARLVRRMYADGARVFVELGPRSTCARWINETLGDQPHVAVSIDQMGAPDRVSLVRMLAALISHRVPMNLSALYAPLPQETGGRAFVRTIRPGGVPVYSAIVNDANRTAISQQGRVTAVASTPSVGAESPLIPAGHTHSADFPRALADVHAGFLRSRRDALRQLGQMIELQMSVPQSGAPARPPVPEIPAEPATPVAPALPAPPQLQPQPAPSVVQGITPMYNDDMVRTFATGRIADCFGDRYAIYDGVRAPRIPNGDLLLMDRVINITGERYQMQPGTSIHAEYDVPVDAWFYTENPYPVMPYSVYMEIALQPCGFLSAHHGPTLEYPDIDFYFRNLDGQGKLHRDLDMRGRTITNHVTLLNSTTMQGIIIQKFSFALYDGDDLFYEGDATFGYFTLQALDSQAGLDAGKQVPRWIDTPDAAQKQHIQVDPRRVAGPGYMQLGQQRLAFTDAITIVPEGGTYGEGYAYANTIIDPSAWYFSCHFYEDPVMPGSIGVETIMQAMQAFAIESGLDEGFQAPRFAQTDGGHNIVWKYRGQILSNSEKSHVEANIKRIERAPGRVIIYADASLWRDRLRIYEVKDIALSILETAR